MCKGSKFERFHSLSHTLTLTDTDPHSETLRDSHTQRDRYPNKLKHTQKQTYKKSYTASHTYSNTLKSKTRFYPNTQTPSHI